MSKTETANSEADDERVSVEVPMTPAMRERIEIEVDGEEADVADWIETVVSQRLAELDKELAQNVTASPEVEIPEEVAEYARLRTQDHHARGKDTSIDEMLMDYVTVSPKYTVRGEPLREESEDVPARARESEGDELTVARDAIAEAIHGDADHDEAAKRALGEIAAYNATDTSTPATVEAVELLEGSLGESDEDEKVHVLKQALYLLE